MQMAGYIFSFFHMAVYSQGFHGKNLLRHRMNVGNPRFFLYLPDCNRQKIRLPIRMSSKPGPGVVNIVIYHKNSGSLPVHNPGGSRHMGYCIFSGKSILIISDPVQDQTFVFFFLLIIRLVFFYLISQFLTVHSYPSLSALLAQSKYSTDKSRILHLTIGK